MGKIIFLDIDGTIRGFSGMIPDSAKEAIAKARQNGHKVCISSGRPYFQVPGMLPGLKFDGVISGSGSYVSYEGECLRHKYITQFTYLALCNYLTQHGCVFELMTHNNYYVLQQSVEEFLTIGREIQTALGETAANFVDDEPTVIGSLLDVYEIEKILFFSETLSLEDVKRTWDTCFYIVPSSVPCGDRIAGEITPANVTKAAGILSILEKSGHEIADVIAIGDSDNDIDMLKLAGRGIAMGNGNDAVKAVADYVTLPLDQDGLYHAFVHEGLI